MNSNSSGWVHTCTQFSYYIAAVRPMHYSKLKQRLKAKRGISTMCLRHIVLSLYFLFDLLNNIICVIDLAIDEMVKVKQTLVISFRMCAVSVCVVFLV